MVISSIIHNSDKMQRTQTSTNRQMDKQNVAYLTMEYFSAIKRNEVLIHATTWINLEKMLSERS